MTVFISHSFDNKPEFENVTASLGYAGVPYWDPGTIGAGGASLRDQLRSAVSACDVCIFIATRSSVRSNWCNAELGAFWSAGLPVIVYLAESSLPESDLPEIVRGDVWERVLTKVATRAKELSAGESTDRRTTAAAPTDRLGTLTVAQFERLVAGAVALTMARSDEGAPTTGVGTIARDAAGHVLRAADATSRLAVGVGQDWRRHILWVDDRPDNNVYERETFEALGFTFTLAVSTLQALDVLERARFAAVISDMGRREGPREGYALLSALRAQDRVTPFFIYAGSGSAAHRQEAITQGAQGSTNIAGELVDMVTQALRAQL